LAELAGQPGQFPLRAVAQVAFQPPPLPVLRGDEPLTGGTQVGEPGHELLG
jgi:hypothetical protein